MIKFQRRLLPSNSSSYLEMEEYTPPATVEPSNSMGDSTSDLSEIESVCSLSTNLRPRSDSLNNLFHLSEDNTSVSNLSLASYSLSQHSTDTNSPRTLSNTFFSNSSDKSSRTRRSMGSLNSNSQKSFSIKTTETVLSTIGNHPSSSDKCGLIAHDGNEDDLHQDSHSNDPEYFQHSDEDNDLDTMPSQPTRRLRRTVFNNVDRLLNSANKQIKL